VPDPSLSLRQGAVAPWAKTGNTSPYYTQTLDAICRHYKASMAKPWSDLPEKVQDVILHGSGEKRSPSPMMTGCAATKLPSPLRA
jgi:excinuclease ABC subunit A